MLVLSRKAGEEIVVPACRLTVTVLSIEGKKVRLGISAPRGIVVHRTEVLDRIAASPVYGEAALLVLEDPHVDSHSDR